jgi:hypothetical protein
MLGERIDPGSAGVAQTEKFGDLVVGFASGIVDRAAHVSVGPCGVGSLLLREIQVGVAARDYKSEQRQFHGSVRTLARLHQYSVNVAFEVVDADERLIEAKRESLRIGNTYEQRTGKTRPLGNGDGVEIREGDIGARHGLTNHRNDVT